MFYTNQDFKNVRSRGATTRQDFDPDQFTTGDVYEANLQNFEFKDLTISKIDRERTAYTGQFEILGNLVEPHMVDEVATVAGEFVSPQDQRVWLDNNTDLVKKLQVEHPDAGLMTTEEVDERLKVRSDELRNRATSIGEQAGTFAKFVGAAGAFIVGSAKDPLVAGLSVLSFPAGGTIGAARTVLGTFAKTGAIEGGISLGIEGVAQAVKFKDKQLVEPEHTAQKAIVETLFAGFGGATIGGTLAAAAKAVSLYRAAVKAGTITPTKELDDAIQVMEEGVDISARTPYNQKTQLAVDAHDHAYVKAASDLQAGRAVDINNIVAPVQMRVTHLSDNTIQQLGDNYTVTAAAKIHWSERSLLERERTQLQGRLDVLNQRTAVDAVGDVRAAQADEVVPPTAAAAQADEVVPPTAAAAQADEVVPPTAAAVRAVQTTDETITANADQAIDSPDVMPPATTAAAVIDENVVNPIKRTIPPPPGGLNTAEEITARIEQIDQAFIADDLAEIAQDNLAKIEQFKGQKPPRDTESDRLVTPRALKDEQPSSTQNISPEMKSMQETVAMENTSIREAEILVESQGSDINVPVTTTLVDGVERVETRTARELFDEADAEIAAVERIQKCLRG